MQVRELGPQVPVLLAQPSGASLETPVFRTLPGEVVQLGQVVRHLPNAGLHGLAEPLVAGEVPVVSLSVLRANLRAGYVRVEVRPGAAQLLEPGDLRQRGGRENALRGGAVALRALLRGLLLGPFGGGGRGRV